MKKVLIGIVVVAVFAAAGMPFVSGLIMERVVENTSSDLNTLYADSGYDMKVTVEKYERGFTSTEIEWKLDLGSMQAFTGIDEVIFTEHAKHGYTGVVSRTTLEKNSWYSDFVEEKLGGTDPLTITTRYGLSGDMVSTLSLAGFSLPVDSEVIEVKPGEFVVNYGEHLEQADMRGTWQGVGIADKAVMEEISFASNLKKVSTYIWSGDFSFAVENIAGEEEGVKFQLAGLKAAYDMDYMAEKKAMSIQVNYGFDSLLADQQSIKDGTLNLAFNNLDAQGYEEFMQMYMATVQSLMGDLARVDEDPQALAKSFEKQMTAMSLKMMAAYEKLLKKDLEIKVSDFSVMLPAGKIEGTMALRLNRDMTFAQFVPIMGEPSLAFEIFSLNTALSFPSELAAGDQNLTAPMLPGMETGIFVEEGDRLVHQAETKEGKLFLNGQELQL